MSGADVVQIPCLVIAGPGTCEIEIKKSRFIGAVGRAATEDEARAFIAERKRLHWDANHNCSAYILGEGGRIMRSSDDGEPAGSAGIPMLTVVQNRGLTDTVVVVARYFGGTLLGVGGLIRAYGRAATAALDAADIVERQSRLLVGISATHQAAGRLEHALRTSPIALQEVAYGQEVVFTVQIMPSEFEDLAAWVAETTNGASAARVLREAVVEIPVSPAEPRD